jgi:rhomboid family GlyGly-CTERM serine protease
VLLLCNAHFLVPFPDPSPWLEYRRQAVLDGELWRLLTCHLVHDNAGHFFWDVSVFVLLGLLYEPDYPRSLPMLVVATGLALGLVLVLFLPEQQSARGMSGIDYSLMIAALWAEAGRARQRGLVNALAVAGAALILAVNVVHECVTGQMVFNAELLAGDVKLLWVAHPTGTVVALVFLAVRHEALKGDPVPAGKVPEKPV